MVEISIQVPDELAKFFGETPEARSRRLVEDAAIRGYERGDLSHREVGKLLGMDYWETEKFFVDRGVKLNYSLADLEQDRENAKILFPG